MRRHLQQKKGFTLVELVVGVVIVGVLCAIAIPMFPAILEKSRRTVCASNRHQLARSIQLDLIAGSAAPTAVESGRLCPSGGNFTLQPVDTFRYVINCSVHGADEGGGGAGQTPANSATQLHVLDEYGQVVTITTQEVEVGMSSKELQENRFVYFPGSERYEAGYYYFNAGQYSSSIKDIDAYLDLVTGWSKRNFVKIDTDTPVQTYTYVPSEKNSSVVRHQLYYIDFDWDDVDGPVLAMYIGSTNDTFYRGDLGSTKYNTNKGLWAIVP